MSSEPATGAAAPLIELAGVGRVHAGEDGAPVRALADVSLAIEAGEFVCVTGPSGSGKSTLLHILGCLDRPTEGQYRVAGEDVVGLDADGLARLRRTTFGFVFQAGHLLPARSARANVRLASDYVGVGRAEGDRRADELLESLGLQHRAHQRAEDLSGGERQRVAIARAVMNHPKVVLADEPTGAIDSAQSEAVLATLRELATQGHAVVVATHDRTIADAAPRHIELQDGRLVADSGAPAGTLQPAPPALSDGSGPRIWSAFRLAAGAALSALRLRPLLASVVVLGVAVGAGAVVSTLGVAAGAYDESTATFGRLGADEIKVAGGIHVAFAPQDLDPIRQLPNVRNVDLTDYRQLGVRRGDRVAANVGGYGTQGAALPHFQRMAYRVAAGAFLTPDDDAIGARVVVLGARLRRDLFSDDTKVVGEEVQIAGLPFTVKGVLAPPPVLIRQRGPDGVYPVAWLPFSVLRAVVPSREVPGFPSGGASATVWVEDPGRAWETAEAIRDLLIRQRGADAEQALVSPLVDEINAYLGLVRARVAVVGGVAAVTLLVAGFGVMAVMLASVSQRTREIGLRLAVGARPRDVHWQFVGEAAVLAFGGGVGGALLGVATGALVSKVADAPVAYDAWFVPAAVGCAVVVGLVFGILPARRAAATNPVAALTAE